MLFLYFHRIVTPLPSPPFLRRNCQKRAQNVHQCFRGVKRDQSSHIKHHGCEPFFIILLIQWVIRYYSNEFDNAGSLWAAVGKTDLLQNHGIRWMCLQLPALDMNILDGILRFTALPGYYPRRLRWFDIALIECFSYIDNPLTRTLEG